MSNIPDLSYSKVGLMGSTDSSSQKRVSFASDECSMSADTSAQELGVVIERSGSMASMRSELVEGLNVFMEEQRKVGRAKVTVVQFDNTVETVIDNVALSDVPTFGDEDFQPRGMTALLDGIGSLVRAMESRVPSGKLEGKAAPVIVILTDGMENASQTFSRSDICDLIKAKKELGWKFTFMGTNQCDRSGRELWTRSQLMRYIRSNS